VHTLGKAALLTPMYVSVAWTLMISYQLFTETAVTSVVTQISSLLPQAGIWLSSRMDLIIFIYAFAWVFVLSSAIPSVILGKERGVLVQFFVCLTLTFLAFVILDVLKTYGGNLLNQMLSLSFLFSNPILAGLYLSIPYITLIALDLRCRKRNKAKEEIETYVQSDMEPVTVEFPKE
jgi:hypothetical protein